MKGIVFVYLALLATENQNESQDVNRATSENTSHKLGSSVSAISYLLSNIQFLALMPK